MISTYNSTRVEVLFNLALGMTKDEEERAAISSIQNGSDSITFPELALEDQLLIDTSERLDLTDSIAVMTLAEKIKLALNGGRSARRILIRKAAKTIQLFVLKNPKITEREVREYAGLPSLDEQVLRDIGTTTVWTRNYQIRFQLAVNSKTPIDVALNMLRTLSIRDLRRIVNLIKVKKEIAEQARVLIAKNKGYV